MSPEENRWGGGGIWGDGHLWGQDAVITHRKLTWLLEVDWLNTGAFDGSNEAHNQRSFHSFRGRKYLINSNSTGFEPVRPGTATVVLRNTDGRYTSDNVDGPLYPNVSIGRLARIRVYHEPTTTYYSVIAGRISDINEAQDSVTIVIEEDQKLLQSSVYLPLQEFKSADYLISLLLDKVSWPAVWGRSLGVSQDEIPYWWSDGERARSAISMLEDFDRGIFYAAADGKATWLPGTESGVDTGVVLTDAKVLENPTVPTSREVVRNRMQVRVSPMVESTTAVTLWEATAPLGVAAGATEYVWSAFKDSFNQSCGAVDLIDPVATTDYTANTLSGGGGTDLTADFVVEIQETYAKSALLKVTNNSASAGYLLSGYKLRGKTVTSPGSSIAREENLTSQAALGVQSLDVDLPWFQDKSTAESFITRVMGMLSDASGFPEVRMRGSSVDQFAPDLFVVVQVDLNGPRVNRYLRVSSIEHKWLDEAGGLVDTTFTFEPFFDLSGYWTFDVEIGIDSIFAP